MRDRTCLLADFATMACWLGCYKSVIKEPPVPTPPFIITNKSSGRV